jgi:hypothetical protein
MFQRAAIAPCCHARRRMLFGWRLAERAQSRSLLAIAKAWPSLLSVVIGECRGAHM